MNDLDYESLFNQILIRNRERRRSLKADLDQYFDEDPKMVSRILSEILEVNDRAQVLDSMRSSFHRILERMRSVRQAREAVQEKVAELFASMRRLMDMREQMEDGPLSDLTSLFRRELSNPDFKFSLDLIEEAELNALTVLRDAGMDAQAEEAPEVEVATPAGVSEVVTEPEAVEVPEEEPEAPAVEPEPEPERAACSSPLPESGDQGVPGLSFEPAQDTTERSSCAAPPPPEPELPPRLEDWGPPSNRFSMGYGRNEPEVEPVAPGPFDARAPEYEPEPIHLDGGDTGPDLGPGAEVSVTCSEPEEEGSPFSWVSDRLGSRAAEPAGFDPDPVLAPIPGAPSLDDYPEPTLEPLDLTAPVLPEFGTEKKPANPPRNEPEEPSYEVEVDVLKILADD